jgi:hypothetical protein
MFPLHVGADARLSQFVRARRVAVSQMDHRASSDRVSILVQLTRLVLTGLTGWFSASKLGSTLPRVGDERLFLCSTEQQLGAVLLRSPTEYGFGTELWAPSSNATRMPQDVALI